MNRRRLEMGLRWVDVIAEAKITDSALRAIRRGEYPPGELTARRLEDILQWAYGSIDAILNGGEPTPIKETAGDQGTLDQRLDRRDQLLDEILERVEQIRKIDETTDRDRQRKTGT